MKGSCQVPALILLPQFRIFSGPLWNKNTKPKVKTLTVRHRLKLKAWENNQIAQEVLQSTLVNDSCTLGGILQFCLETGSKCTRKHSNLFNEKSVDGRQKQPPRSHTVGIKHFIILIAAFEPGNCESIACDNWDGGTVMKYLKRMVSIMGHKWATFNTGN